jgi:hypothetical protein
MLQDHLNVIDMNQRAVFVQDLDEPAHVGALEMVWQINRQRNRGYRVLRRMSFISDLDRESEIRDTDTINRHFPVIGLILRIHECGDWLRVHRFRILISQCPFHPGSGQKIAMEACPGSVFR